MKTLINCLTNAGQPSELLRQPDGSSVLMLQHGGRVLGLYAAGSDENFYWTNPALSSADTARAFYASDAWHNSGGDRTWISPEVDLFYPDFPSLARYFQPRQLDPGRYEIIKGDGDIRLVNRLVLTLSRTGQTVALEMSKSIGSAANPLRHERNAHELLALKYAGYTQQTTLIITGDATARVGAWNLIQMPHGGDLLVPVYSRTRPKMYFGPIPAEDLIADDRLVRYRMRSGGIHKIGVRAVALTGRVGYLYRTGSEWALVIRNFHVDPSGDYVDVPPDDFDDVGYAVQACNVVHDELGSFSELEYHVPAIGGATGRTRCEDYSCVWAFRGPAELIQSAAQILLTANTEVTS